MILIILTVLGSILNAIGVIFYLVGVIKGVTKPRIATWIIWTILTVISCAASFVDKQYLTVSFLSVISFFTFLVVIFGWRFGDKKIEKLDIICFLGAIIGIILWYIFNSPSIAVIIMIIADFIGGIPTLVHAWKKPAEESLINFCFAFIGCLLMLFAQSNWKITAVAFPLFLTLINFIYVLVISFRRKILYQKKRC